MANMTIDAHKRRIANYRRLAAHMQGVYLQRPSAKYAEAMKGLLDEIKAYECALWNAEAQGRDGFERKPYRVWPSDEDVKLSRGRAGDVDPSGVMTKQQCGRGVRIIGGIKCAVSNGEW